MLPTEARVGHLATIRARRLHAYMPLGHVPSPCNCSCPPPCSASLPFVRSRTVVPCLVPQVGVSRVSCEWPHLLPATGFSFLHLSLLPITLPSSKIGYTLLNPKVCPTCFPFQSWRTSCVYPPSHAHGLLVEAPGCTHCARL